MEQNTLLIAVTAGIALLLFLILKMRIQAFLALLISALTVGLLAGMPAEEILKTVQNGMGSTLGYVATVVGLGAIFGALLEHSGGAQVIAEHILKKTGEEKAPLAMSLTGFLIAIPVFFEVGFILMVPMLYALKRRTGKSLLLYAIPLLAGLAVTHAFIPPTPGPIAVADILQADLGMVIIVGVLTGVPAALTSGLLFGRYISGRISGHIPEGMESTHVNDVSKLPSFRLIMLLIGIPILLIVLNTLTKSQILFSEAPAAASVFLFLGHPFTALIIANILAWYSLGLRMGTDKATLQEMTTKSLAPAGIIILITGAGGAFKQMLVDTGAGEMLAGSLSSYGIPVLLFAFIIAALVRIIQGSATVAMITAAGLVAPLTEINSPGSLDLACLVIAIAAGSSIFSHVNDSGFWLVSRYLGLTEKETLASWSVMTTILALTGLAAVSLVALLG